MAGRPLPLRFGIRGAQLEIGEPFTIRLLSRHAQQRGGPVDAHHGAARAHAPGGAQGGLPASRGQIQHPHVRSQLGEVQHALAERRRQPRFDLVIAAPDLLDGDGRPGQSASGAIGASAWTQARTAAMPSGSITSVASGGI